MRTGIKFWMSSNLSRVRLFTTELFALEHSHWLWMGKCCLHLFSVTMNSVIIKLTGNKDRHKISDEFKFRSYLTSHFGVMCSSGEKNSFSQSLLIGSLSDLQIMRTCINAPTSSNLGQIGLFTMELFALECRFFSPWLVMGKKVKQWIFQKLLSSMIWN